MSQTERSLEQLEQGAARRLIAALPRAAAEAKAPGGFRAKVWTRIEEGHAASGRFRLPGRVAVWLPAAAAGALLLAVGYPLLYPAADAPAYRTLSTGAANGSAPVLRLRAVFVPDTTLAELQTLLQRHDASVLAGPTPHGVYTLALHRNEDAAVEQLRAHSAVLLLEPLTGAGAP